MSGKPAVFFDRDGTLIEEVEYLVNPDEIKLVNSAATAVRKVNEKDLLCIVVTNQSAVARGQLPEEDLRRINQEISARFAREGATIDAIYYCPHHPSVGRAPYLIDCNCRKPKPGLLTLAAASLGIDLGRSVLIGDSLRDIEAGHRAGCSAVLVLTGNGPDEALKAAQGVSQLETPDYIASGILPAVAWALEKIGE